MLRCGSLNNKGRNYGCLYLYDSIQCVTGHTDCDSIIVDGGFNQSEHEVLLVKKEVYC